MHRIDLTSVETLGDADREALAALRRRCAGDICRATCLARCGHPGGSLSTLDMLLMAYATGRLDPEQPRAPQRDRVIVSHGHIRVNGVKCNIASRRIKVGDVISLGNKAKEMALVIEAQSLPERDIPDYVAPDGNDKVTFTRVPKLDEVPYPVTMEPNLVVEFYSR